MKKDELIALCQALAGIIIGTVIGLLIVSKCKAQTYTYIPNQITITHKYINIKITKYIPSATCVFVAALSDGLRDASMYRMDGYSQWMNGKQSWTNKYKNHNINQGPAFWQSTGALVFVTDLPHAANTISHQFTGMALAFMPPDDNKRFGHIFLKVLAYNAIRQAGHFLIYDVAFKTQGRD